ncbi:transglycosylase domain-containing protein [Streptomyces sp. UNOC14_S4]|uniref:transglycosylase domain-containing protein n=1 Tax=Streptomyces sp. UNOC14_S4 TaxID=2872340 RepID=UPI001E5559F2|nr:transglycosylase domain-containing protein [Streptomyces sp. UNOC14_S4]MCC3771759.1 penicillin-binding protein [Streptomyces sp. UNOC14_S4]
MGRAEARRAQKSTRKKGGKPKKTGIRRFFTWKKLLAYFVTLIALGAGAFVALYMYVDIPNGKMEMKLQSNIYLDAKGKVLARTGEVNREEVTLDKVPDSVKNAVVAAENKNFWNDSGVDIKGTARGILNTLMGRGKQGGSTITQQYVKNSYLSQEQTVTRKVKELIITLKVDQKVSKEEILAGYLNTSYFGRNAYGIQAAARAYYGKDVKDITPEEGAYLAALLQAPSQYDWSAASDAGKRNAQARWNYVLDKEVEQKWLDPAKRKDMKFEVPKPPKAPEGLTGQNGYLVDAAKKELEQFFHKNGRGDGALARGGWTIKLSIDSDKQKALEQAVKDKVTSRLDKQARKVDNYAQVGAVSVDRKTGKVVALYGGEDFAKHQISNATREDYQPASTFKPLIFASALDNASKTQDGQPITASTMYDGTSERPVRGSDTPFAPQNEDHVSYGNVTVQDAMNKSVNSVFAQMAVDVGLDKVKKTAVDLGMNREAGGFDERPAMSLGSMSASPLHMAGVYATLANHGKKVTPSIVESLTHNGEKVAAPETIGSQVLSRTHADDVTNILRGVVNDGTATVVQSSQYAVAGKTGTSDDNKSAWFTGYTPDLITSVGMFGEGPGGAQVPLTGTGGVGRVNGGGYPAEIWAAYTGQAADGETEFDLKTDEAGAVPPPPAPTGSAKPTPSASGQPTPSGSASPTTKPTPTSSGGTPTKDPTDKPTPPKPPTDKPKPPTDKPVPPTGGGDGGDPSTNLRLRD